MSQFASAAQPSEVYLLVRVRSIFACLMHWVLVTSVIVLTVTGFYIADPSFYYGQGEAWQAYAMGNVRMWHFIAAWALVAGSLIRLYLAFTTSCNRDIFQFLPTPRNIVAAIKLASFYITGKGKHEHYRFVNPLGGGLGIFSMAALFLFQAITGIALYAGGADAAQWAGLAPFIRDASEWFFGGNQSIRLFHHLAMYGLITVVLIHIYMQIWKAAVFTESDISSIIAGYKMFPYRLYGHFRDHYGLIINEPPPTKEMMDRESTEMKEVTE